MEIVLSKYFSCETNRLLFTKKIREIGIFRFFNLFSKIWKTGEKHNADNTSNKAKPCPILTSILNKGEEKLF